MCSLTDATTVKDLAVEDQGSRYSMRTRGQSKAGDNKENGAVTGKNCSSDGQVILCLLCHKPCIGCGLSIPSLCLNLALRPGPSEGKIP